jgi:hypothetical protein
MNIRQIAYEKYKLNWMMEHGYTIVDLFECVGKHLIDDPDWSLADAYDEWELSDGFHGEIWCCFEEFLDCEYQDKEYMSLILDTGEYYEYLKDMEEDV